MPVLYAHETLPASSEAAIREFNEKYLAVISAVPANDWFRRYVVPVAAPRTTFPIGLLAAKYQETKEASGRFKDMAEKDFDLKVSEFDDGFQVKVWDLLHEVFAYRNWSKVPANLQIAEDRHVAKNLIALLEAGTSTTSPWDGVNFFATTHKSNPKITFANSDGTKDTWSNYNNAGLAPETLANIQAEMSSMRDVRDTNGEKLGVEPDEIWLPTEKFQIVSDKLNQALIANGESNPLLGKIKPVHMPDLTDVNDWYLVDSKMIARGVDPFVAANHTDVGSLGLRFLDESSDFFKNSGKIAVTSHIWYGFSLLFPHAIRKVAGA